MTERGSRFNRRASARSRSQIFGSGEFSASYMSNSRSSSRNSSFQNVLPLDDMNDLESGPSFPNQTGNGIENGDVSGKYYYRDGLKRFQPKLGFLWCWLFLKQKCDALRGLKNCYFFRSTRVFRFMLISLVFVLPIVFVFSLGFRIEINTSNDALYFHFHWSSGYDQTEESNGPWVIGVIADLDKGSKVSSPKESERWKSYFKRGKLSNVGTQEFSFVLEWLDDSEGVEISTRISEDGRGMELSDLCKFQNRILAPDDRTGIVYEIMNPLGGIDRFTGQPYVAARYVLSDGNGNEVKGFKGEWMTVKDKDLYIGGHGRERTSAKNGTHIESYNPMWVKRIDAEGTVHHLDWSDNYNAVRRAAGASFPGYLENEAVLWSSRRRCWIFLPRRWSQEPYDDEKNEYRGWNKEIIASEDFSQIHVVDLDIELDGEKGFSSAKFVPGSNENLICALRTVEHEETNLYETYLTIFSVDNGKLFFSDALVGRQKYEGIEFLAEWN
eukprot:jgi/Galph1/3677/GphlegSOOS_G2349.1